MSGNSQLTADLAGKFGSRLVDSKLYPFHLAVSYLNGSKECCLVLEELQSSHPLTLRKLYVNDLGHTVLDHIMMAVLKAHTSCLPSVVDPVFKREKRFEGEDIDVCGRWDADSDCVRTLLAKGVASIPFKWKHVFCHTSVQAVCHCIGTIFGPDWAPDINLRSGLFVKRCLHCGLKMELLPLHALVLIGLHLCVSGCEGETLFGLLATLLCLLRNGANPLLKTELSLQAILNKEQLDECDHEMLYPVQLAEKVPASLTSKFPKELRTGWQLFCNILKHSHKSHKTNISRAQRSTSMETEVENEFNDLIDYSEDDMSIDGSQDADISHRCDLGHINYFGDSGTLAPLWAAVQTELLTYRRLKEGDSRISQDFDMAALTESFIKGTQINIPFYEKGMLKPFCSCGEFRNAVPACPTTEDATTQYLSNLEDWGRSSFINCPEMREDYWRHY